MWDRWELKIGESRAKGKARVEQRVRGVGEKGKARVEQKVRLNGAKGRNRGRKVYELILAGM